MKSRSFFHRISTLLLLLTLTFLSPQARADSSEKPAPVKRLTVTATQDKSAPSVQVPLEELDPGNKASLTYVGLTDVCIETSQGKKPLETGIQDGDISVEEIFAYARLDARNGFCTEHKNSIHGLTHFIYVYPGYKLYAAYDLYETPDGKQHLVNELVFAAKSSNLTFSYEDLDQEDWGLTFEISQADAHSVTLTCTQKGGQQAGKLVLEVKFTELLPQLVRNILPPQAAEFTAVSKYVLCYEKTGYLNGFEYWYETQERKMI